MLIMNKNYLIAIETVWRVFSFSVTMKSTGVSFPLPALFTLENLPVHKLGSQQLNCRAVFLELSDTENNNNNNNNNNIYLLQLGCNPVAVVILHVHKT